MAFSIIQPSPINGKTLLANSVTTTEYLEYNGATTYALDARVMVNLPNAVVTVSIGTPCIVTWVNHGITDGEQVYFTTTGALPTGVNTTSAFYAYTINADTFHLTTERNGTPLTTSGTQSGTHTCVIDTHYVYQSLQASNIGNEPRLSDTWWIRVSNTNPYNMFDESPSVQTLELDQIYVKVQGSGVTDAVALMNVDCGSVRYRMRDTLNTNTVTISVAAPAVVTQTAHGFVDGQSVLLTSTGALPTGLTAEVTYYVINSTANTYNLSATLGGAAIATTGAGTGVHSCADVVYDKTYNMEGGMLGSDWYSYYYNPIQRIDSNVELELPHISSGIVEVWLTSDNVQTVAVGNIIVGQRFEFGLTSYGTTTGIQDYSVKTTDAFGNFTINERKYAKRGDFSVEVDSSRTAGIQTQLAKYRATPIVYVGDASYHNTIIYGFYRDFSIDIAMFSTSICSLQLEGLK